MLTAVQRLEIEFTANEVAPPGSSIASVGRAIMEPGRIGEAARLGKVQAAEAISLIRGAAEPNPWKDATDEEIAAEILRRVDERRRELMARAESREP